MDQPKVWGLSRYITLLAVLALHLVLLAALVLASRTQNISAPANQTVELLVIPPAKIPKVRFESSHPQHLSGGTAISVAPPVLDSPSSSTPSSASEGNGTAVDWGAEAHRAIQAFEIRNHQPPDNNAASVSPFADDWWPARHRAGDQFKTDSGDWIVWINASCYQVAAAAARYTFDATPPRTICSDAAGAPRGDSSERKNLRPKD